MMPRKETLRKYYPDSKLSDDELMETAEWLKNHLRQKAISPDNQALAVLIAYLDEQKVN